MQGQNNYSKQTEIWGQPKLYKPREPKPQTLSCIEKNNRKSAFRSINSRFESQTPCSDFVRGRYWRHECQKRTREAQIILQLKFDRRCDPIIHPGCGAGIYLLNPELARHFWMCCSEIKKLLGGEKDQKSTRV